VPNFSILDIRASELYSEPDVADLKPAQDEYGEPVDSLQPTKTPEEVLANPIYEGIYSEPLYGIAGTILVGPQVKLTYILVFFVIHDNYLYGGYCLYVDFSKRYQADDGGGPAFKLKE
jgi:hypothetical protein